MKKIWALFATLCLCINLTSCGNSKKDPTEVVSMETETTSELSEMVTEQTEEQVDEKEISPERKAYAQFLVKEYPSYFTEQLDSGEGTHGMFALEDLNQDGIDELIVEVDWGGVGYYESYIFTYKDTAVVQCSWRDNQYKKYHNNVGIWTDGEGHYIAGEYLDRTRYSELGEIELITLEDTDIKFVETEEFEYHEDMVDGLKCTETELYKKYAKYQVEEKEITFANIVTECGGDLSGVIFADSSERELTESELMEKSAEDLRIARNEIWARHGYSFKDEALREHFNKQIWYSASDEAVTEESLNDIEKSNVALIKSMEDRVQSGNNAYVECLLKYVDEPFGKFDLDITGDGVKRNVEFITTYEEEVRDAIAQYEMKVDGASAVVRDISEDDTVISLTVDYVYMNPSQIYILVTGSTEDDCYVFTDMYAYNKSIGKFDEIELINPFNNICAAFNVVDATDKEIILDYGCQTAVTGWIFWNSNFSVKDGKCTMIDTEFDITRSIKEGNVYKAKMDIPFYQDLDMQAEAFMVHDGDDVVLKKVKLYQNHVYVKAEYDGIEGWLPMPIDDYSTDNQMDEMFYHVFEMMAG